jgi:hypothetical protein
MSEGGVVVESGVSDGTPFSDMDETRQIYDVSSGTWDECAKDASSSGAAAVRGVEVTEPIKQLLADSSGTLFSVSRANVYASYDNGATWVETDGLAGVGVVHHVAEAHGVMYAATDLGVYVMLSPNVWTQGGLIGAGATESFDLLEYSLFYPNGDGVLAATEIGLFFSADLARTWTRVTPSGMEDVRNVEPFGTDTLFVTAGQEVWKTINRGLTWTRTGRFAIIDGATRLVARGTTDMFLGTATGLYRSVDGVDFDALDFDLNRDDRLNAVHFVGLVGSDVCVAYDLEVFLLGADLAPIKVAAFTGVVPAVRVDGTDSRHGHRYDVGAEEIIFEYKRFSTDEVTVATNYALYALLGGPWHAQNASAPIQVFVNGAETEDYEADAWTGRLAFGTALTKPDVVTVSLANIFLDDAGSYFHTELEDKFEREKGLPLSLGRDLACNVLQAGLAMEHNFWERGVERNQYYCFAESTVDRSLNSFLRDARFVIMGRNDFDSFNSTIDYRKESEQPDVGESAVLCLSTLLYLDDLMLVGTDSGLFLLDGVPGGISDPILLSVEEPDDFLPPVRGLSLAFGEAYAVAKSGVYKLTISGRRVTAWEKNPGNGLPDVVSEVGDLGDLLVAATEDGMYYADDASDPEFSEWTRASHVDLNERTDLPLLGPATTMVVKDGMAYAGIGNEVYRSQDGRVWRRIFQLTGTDQIADPGAVTSAERNVAANAVISRIIVFEDRVYLATRSGLYNDDGSARSNEVVFRLEDIGDDVAVSDMDEFAASSSAELLVVGESPYVYSYRASSGASGPVTPAVVQGGETTLWTKEKVADLPALDKVVALPNGTRVVFSGRSIFFR